MWHEAGVEEECKAEGVNEAESEMALQVLSAVQD